MSVVLAACDRNDSNNGFVPAPLTPTRAVAVAGDDFEVLGLASGVALKGAKSYDPAGGALTYAWTQTAGATVTLSDPAVASPTFTAPAAPDTLTFRLTVTGPSGSDTDSVTVAVKSMIVTAPDAWFVGYEKALGNVTATVSGGTGPFTYQWTGIEPWLTVVDANANPLVYTTPKLTDFQNFPDRAEVGVLERTTQGRLQLKIKVTDSLGATDEDLVNFSAGPFADAVANDNAALGEPVFLNGGATIPATPTPTAVATWTWSGTKPSGAAVTFFRPTKAALSGATDQRFVYFVPDQLGDYEIQVRQNDMLPSAVTKVVNVHAGKYVGVGNLTGRPPDPYAGECAACHGGQFGWLADFANPWRQTGHARMFETLLDPTSPYFGAAQSKGQWNDAFNFGSNYSIDSRTVGWSRPGPNPHGGWAEQATADGYVFKDSTWEELVRKHPTLAGLSNVQCESCHGPGSEHAGDSTAIRKSFDSSVCGRCHSRKQDLWEASGHGKPPITSPSGSGSCNNCHTAQGYVVEMRAQEGADPHTALFAVGSVNRPVIPFEDRRGTTCQACHEPHKKTAKRTASGVDPQLRAFGRVQFRNGAVADAGEAATCYTCHHSRRDGRDNSTDANERRGPHDATMAEMLSATNGSEFAGWSYTSSPHGIASRFVTPSRGENRQCLACHNDVQPGKGAVGYNGLGGHTFAVKQGSGTVIAGDGTHAGGATVAGSNRFTVASGPSLLKSVFTGDTVVVSAGTDTGTFTVNSVDGARQMTLSGAAPFTGGAANSWSLTSTVKYNSASCTQCHTTAVDFRDVARGDYDGDGIVEVVQDEIAGLQAALVAAINAQLPALTGVPSTLTSGGGSIRYAKTGTVPLQTRTFPGPAVTSSGNSEIVWSTLSPTQQAAWLALYKAAYNSLFVASDRSGGIHNTGYAVNLLQSSYKAVTGLSIGSPFAPF